jgi:hypothetical protein
MGPWDRIKEEVQPRKAILLKVERVDIIKNQ